MAKQQQISLSLAFLAAAIILQCAAQATAGRELQEAAGATKQSPEVELILNELSGITVRAKDKVTFLGGSQMVQACDKAYGSALESLNKALNLVKGNGKTEDIKASIDAAYNAYGDCDKTFAESGRPSPFVPSNMNLKALVALFMDVENKQEKKQA
ncbi:Pectinesterase inhibitor [Corchorus olitorius]|uniref:Pectinesterase inhibitor n=1 Tax=Corchorus olitorius TaxID=93759 RepID=A0A1R3IC53_9ROSI|nr:Pectinesterase inhibitor [Corchorus olitorius]